MGSRRQLASIVRCSCGGEMPPVVRGGSSAQQTSSPVVSTSMSAQSSGVTMSCADSSRATPSHAQYRARRQRAGDQHRAVVPRARASAAAPPPPAAVRPLPPSHRVAHRRPRGPAAAQMPIEVAHGAAAAAFAALPTASSYPGILNLIIRPAVGRAARPARPPGPPRRYCGANSRFSRRCPGVREVDMPCPHFLDLHNISATS